MKKIRKKFILSLRRYFKDTVTIRNEYKRIFLAIQIAIIGIITTTTFCITDFTLNGLNQNTAVYSSTFFIYLFSIYLIKIGKFNFGKLLIIFISCVSVAMSASVDGRGAGNEYLWFVVIGCVFLFYSFKNLNYILLSFAFTLSAMFLLEITDYSYFQVAAPNPEYTKLSYIFCLIISVIGVIVFKIYLIKMNSDSERKLERLNKILLIRNRNLEKTNSELDSFVYKASHDMRAPLTSLLGLLSLSKKEEELPTLRNFMEMQEKAILKLDGYIMDILDMSRNARTEVILEEINFKEIVNDIIFQLNPIEKLSKIDIQMQVEETIKYVGDFTRLKVILTNLISNSIRYADYGKPTSSITIKVYVNSNNVFISIWDNGIGIEKQHLDKVFNMFYRATDKNSGSGLGLYIVKETLQKLNGSIQLKSEFGDYTECTLLIPNGVIQK